MNDEQLQTFCKFLSTNTSLLELNIGDNPVGLDSASALSEALKINTTLTV